jgi:hypothetical protein
MAKWSHPEPPAALVCDECKCSDFWGVSQSVDEAFTVEVRCTNRAMHSDGQFRFGMRMRWEGIDWMP